MKYIATFSGWGIDTSVDSGVGGPNDDIIITCTNNDVNKSFTMFFGENSTANTNTIHYKFENSTFDSLSDLNFYLIASGNLLNENFIIQKQILPVMIIEANILSSENIFMTMTQPMDYLFHHYCNIIQLDMPFLSNNNSNETIYDVNYWHLDLSAQVGNCNPFNDVTENETMIAEMRLYEYNETTGQTNTIYDISSVLDIYVVEPTYYNSYYFLINDLLNNDISIENRTVINEIPFLLEWIDHDYSCFFKLNYFFQGEQLSGITYNILTMQLNQSSHNYG